MILYLGQKYLSWYRTVVCMRGLGEGCCAQEITTVSPPTLCLLAVTFISVGVSGRGLVNVQMSGIVFVTAVKLLMLFCGRTSPPGAHEVYVQNNKLQMNKHKLLFLLRACFCRSALAPVSETFGLLPLSEVNLNPTSLIKGNSPFFIFLKTHTSLLPTHLTWLDSEFPSKKQAIKQRK